VTDNTQTSQNPQEKNNNQRSYHS